MAQFWEEFDDCTAPGNPLRQPEVIAKSACPEPEVVPGFTGRWVNRLGSVLELTFQGTTVRGTLQLSSEQTGSQAFTGELRGFVCVDYIALVSQWSGRACLAAWMGQRFVSDDEDTIMFAWNLYRSLDAPGTPTDMVMGTSRFDRLLPQ